MLLLKYLLYIFYSREYALIRNYFIINFSCSDIINVHGSVVYKVLKSRLKSLNYIIVRLYNYRVIIHEIPVQTCKVIAHKYRNN